MSQICSPTKFCINCKTKWMRSSQLTQIKLSTYMLLYQEMALLLSGVNVQANYGTILKSTANFRKDQTTKNISTRHFQEFLTMLFQLSCHYMVTL